MFTFEEKTEHLKMYLVREPRNYADAFKADIFIYFGDDFTDSNPSLNFLNRLHSLKAIERWVDHLCSQFVLKFKEDEEQVSDFIGEFV